MSLGEKNEILFHIRGKTDESRYISTMNLLQNPLDYKGGSFRSMEHAYHCEKFNPKYASHDTPGRLLELSKRLQTDGDIVDPKDAKKFGGKKSFQNLKVTLNVSNFNPDREMIMMDIAMARTRVDPKFAQILLSSSRNNIVLKHHELGKPDIGFWGGDENTLGKIYMEIGDILDNQQGIEESKSEVPEDEGTYKDKKNTGEDDDASFADVEDGDASEEDEDEASEDETSEDEASEDEASEDEASEDETSEDETSEDDGEDDIAIEGNEENGESKSNEVTEGDAEGDAEESDDEDYLQKFDSDVRRNFLEEFHPEVTTHSDVEVRQFANVVRNKEGHIIDDLHRTLPFLTKYEYTRVIGQRAKQIDSGALPFVEVSNDIIDGYTIAIMELKEKKMPFIIRRPMPGGGCEYWKLEDLETLH